MNKAENHKNYLASEEEALSKLLEMGYDFLDKSTIYRILIGQFGYVDNYSLIIHENLTSDKIVDVVHEFYTQSGLPVGNIALDDTIVPNGLLSPFEKAKIKANGEVWVIHRNDKDPFPSSPHAHNYDRHIKVHLGNGDMYMNKEYISTIKQKDFDSLKDEIKKKMGDTFLSTVKSGI